MQNLKKLDLIDTLNEQVLVKKPILGICLGCQLLLNHSEENENIKVLGGLMVRLKNLEILKSFHRPCWLE